MADMLAQMEALLDLTLISQATTGLYASGTRITYDSASLTVTEMYPYILQGAGKSAQTLLNRGKPTHVIMHPGAGIGCSRLLIPSGLLSPRQVLTVSRVSALPMAAVMRMADTCRVVSASFRTPTCRLPLWLAPTLAVPRTLSTSFRRTRRFCSRLRSVRCLFALRLPRKHSPRPAQGDIRWLGDAAAIMEQLADAGDVMRDRGDPLRVAQRTRRGSRGTRGAGAGVAVLRRGGCRGRDRLFLWRRRGVAAVGAGAPRLRFTAQRVGAARRRPQILKPARSPRESPRQRRQRAAASPVRPARPASQASPRRHAARRPGAPQRPTRTTGVPRA